MKKYSVILTRDVTESRTVIVEAKDHEHAHDLAMKVAELGEFERDSNCYEDPYVTDCVEVEEKSEVKP